MKLNRKLVLILALLVSIAMATTGTLAYLSDTDADVNVMTLGNVHIEQIEQERNENGELVSFTQGKPAYPAVGPIDWADNGVDVNGTEYKVFTDELKNVIDKIVTVKNTGASDAYVRTIIAIEAPGFDPEELIHVNINSDGLTYTPWMEIKIEKTETEYVMMAFTYKAALKPGEISAPSLVQLFLDSKADNEYVKALGDTWEVLVVSQAVQAAGFESAEAALNAGFGVVSAESHPWLDLDDNDNPNDQEPDGITMPVFAATAQELKDAMLIRDAEIYLTGDIIVNADTPLQWGAYMFVANGREVTVNLNGNRIIVEEDALLKTHAVFTTANGGTLNITGEGSVEVNNGKSGIFHAMNKNDQINIYSGTFMSNSDNGSTALAIIYTNSGNVDVYGGKFIPRDGTECANAEDAQGNRLSVVFHEGTLLKHSKYYAGSDATRIQLAEGCTLEEVVIDGETWYQVVKK